MRHTFLLFMVAIVATTLQGQVFTNADSARQQAVHEQKPILLYFSGSDWCPHCIRFENSILSDSSFARFARNNIVLLRADFPQKKKLSREMADQNFMLAAEFNPAGRFPAFVLLNSEMTRPVPVYYHHQSAVEFQALIEANIDKMQHGE